VPHVAKILFHTQQLIHQRNPKKDYPHEHAQVERKRDKRKNQREKRERKFLLRLF
jgi:hypothetical protein